LTMLEPAADGTQSRAFLRIGGMTVVRQQLALVLALKCERVVCIAHGLSPELIELQHVAEAAGVQFHVIAGARPLAGLVTAADELIVIADGLFTSTTEAAALLEKGQSVLVQPIEPGLAAGFERIDLSFAGAGAMRIPGRLLERIADLPTDCDAASALQRIALQAGVRQRAIPQAGQDGLFWSLVRSEDEAHALEPQWIRQRTSDGAPLGPSRWLARLAVRGLGPALLHAGSGPLTLVIAAGAAALLALGAGWLALIPLGLGFCALGWILRESAAQLARIDSDLVRPSRGVDSRTAFGWLLDGIVVALAGWSGPSDRLMLDYERYFPALMLVALLRILSQSFGLRVAAWLEDRALLALGLAAAVLLGLGSEAIHIAALAAAIAGIALPGLGSRITRA
jgi:hypothetical protein